MSEHFFDITLDIEDIGPRNDHAKLDFNGQMKDYRLAVYAPNGAGKTFGR